MKDDAIAQARFLIYSMHISDTYYTIEVLIVGEITILNSYGLDGQSCIIVKLA